MRRHAIVWGLVAACGTGSTAATDEVVCRGERSGMHVDERGLFWDITGALWGGTPRRISWTSGAAHDRLPRDLYMDVAVATEGVHVSYRPVDADDDRACPLDHAVEARVGVILRVGDGVMYGYGEGRMWRRSADTDDGLLTVEEIEAAAVDPTVWIDATVTADVTPAMGDALAAAVGASGAPGYVEMTVSGVWPGEIALRGVWSDGTAELAVGTLSDLGRRGPDTGVF